MIPLVDNIYFLPGKSQKSFTRGVGAPNSLVASGTNESVIIDPGVWTYQYRLLKKLSKKKIIDLASFQKVCITHEHWDHSTLACYFQEKFDAQIYSHKESKSALENEDLMVDNFFKGYKFLQLEIVNYPIWATKFMIHLMWGKYGKIKINKTLSDGEKLDFDIPIEAIELPGHTPGNLGFYFTDHNIIATGDLIDLETGIGYDLNSPISDYETAKKSVEKLSQMKIEILISGHGEIVKGEENCQNLFRQRIGNSERLRNDIIDILSKGESTYRKIIYQISGSRNFIDYNLNKHVIYCYLEDIHRNKPIHFRKKGRKTYMSLQ